MACFRQRWDDEGFGLWCAAPLDDRRVHRVHRARGAALPARDPAGGRDRLAARRSRRGARGSRPRARARRVDFAFGTARAGADGQHHPAREPRLVERDAEARHDPRAHDHPPGVPVRRGGLRDRRAADGAGHRARADGRRRPGAGVLRRELRGVAPGRGHPLRRRVPGLRTAAACSTSRAGPPTSPSASRRRIRTRRSSGSKARPRCSRSACSASTGKGSTEQIWFTHRVLPDADLSDARRVRRGDLHELAAPLPRPGRRCGSSMRAAAATGACVFVQDLMRPDSPDAAQALVDQYAPDEPEVLRRDFFNSLLRRVHPRRDPRPARRRRPRRLHRRTRHRPPPDRPRPRLTDRPQLHQPVSA